MERESRCFPVMFHVGSVAAWVKIASVKKSWSFVRLYNKFSMKRSDTTLPLPGRFCTEAGSKVAPFLLFYCGVRVKNNNMTVMYGKKVLQFIKKRVSNQKTCCYLCFTEASKEFPQLWSWLASADVQDGFGWIHIKTNINLELLAGDWILQHLYKHTRHAVWFNRNTFPWIDRPTVLVC